VDVVIDAIERFDFATKGRGGGASFAHSKWLLQIAEFPRGTKSANRAPEHEHDGRLLAPPSDN
jgi:hypothetical protein